jgi:hypothetical protein
MVVDDEPVDPCMIWIYMHENLLDDGFGIYMYMFIYWCECLYE